MSSNGVVSIDSRTSVDYLTSGTNVQTTINGNNFACNIPSVTLDDLLKESQHKQIAIKLDVEGNEFAALEGAKNTIKKLRPIFIIECTNAQTSHNCSEFLKERGYIFYIINDSSFELSLTKELVPLFEDDKVDLNRLNRLAVPIEKKDYMENKIAKGNS